MMKAAAPMIGGVIWPPAEAAAERVGGNTAGLGDDQDRSEVVPHSDAIVIEVDGSVEPPAGGHHGALLDAGAGPGLAGHPAP